jgi:hypothetical protein
MMCALLFRLTSILVVGARCDVSGIQSIGSGRRLNAGERTVLRLTLDATATTLTGTFTCEVFVTIRSQQFWPPANRYQSVPYVFTLYQGCADPIIREAYLEFDEQTWRSLSDPFETVDNPFSISRVPPAWTQINSTTFTTVLIATVRNGGNATATFTGTVDCNNVFSLIQGSGSVVVDPGMNVTLPVNITANGVNVTNMTVTCSLLVQVIRQPCWSTLGKAYSRKVNLTAPYDICSTYDGNEPFLLVSKQEWLEYNQTLYPPPNGLLAINIPSYWTSLKVNGTQLWTVSIPTSVSNQGTHSFLLIGLKVE